jgi:DNA replication licensing factor MCM7
MSTLYPKRDDEKAKCSDFIRNFRKGGGGPYFDTYLDEIQQRDRKLLEISIDDVFEHKNDDIFVENIKKNTPRYVCHFEDAIDGILKERENPNQQHQDDPIDILRNHREATMAEQQQNVNREALEQGLQEPQPNNGDGNMGIPARLLRRYEVRIVPSSDEPPRRLRDIRALEIGHLVKVRGLVTRATDVKPHIAVCTYLCDVCGSEIYMEVKQSTFMPITSCPSRICKENKQSGRVTMQYRGSLFEKYQELRLQELPDQVPVGHIPRSMIVHCRGEQTRQCVPGDIVNVSGTFQTVRLSGYRAMKAGLCADTYIESYHVEKEKKSYSHLVSDPETAARVQEIATDPDPYSRLARSMAPEIFGHEDVKKALLLQLVGGSTRVLPDGMKIRGDINICLMGDPGVAKSQLLKYMATVAPRGVYTTGKGSSGVGLTASVVKDPISGDLALEGGALVLADMGVCCIDEFDKVRFIPFCVFLVFHLCMVHIWYERC